MTSAVTMGVHVVRPDEIVIEVGQGDRVLFSKTTHHQEEVTEVMERQNVQQAVITAEPDAMFASKLQQFWPGQVALAHIRATNADLGGADFVVEGVRCAVADDTVYVVADRPVGADVLRRIAEALVERDDVDSVPDPVGKSLRQDLVELASLITNDARAAMNARHRVELAGAAKAALEAAALAPDETQVADVSGGILGVCRAKLTDRGISLIAAEPFSETKLELVELESADADQIVSAVLDELRDDQERLRGATNAVDLATTELQRVRSLFAGQNSRVSQRQVELISEALAAVEAAQQEEAPF